MLFVTKRDGRKESVRFDKITERISRLINPVELQTLNLSHLDTSNEFDFLDPILIAQKVVGSLYSGITTEELDTISAEICVNLSTTHPRYGYLGGRILISNLHKKTLDSFSKKMILLAENEVISKEWNKWVQAHANELDQMIDYKRDYQFDYFGFKTLEKSYLLKIKKNIIERPQDTLMRTAVTLQMGNLNKIRETYNFMSLGFYTHASPTLYNSGTNHMQLSSCFLYGMQDSLKSISHCWETCAQISKWAGGIGLHVSNIRGKDSLIKGTGGQSNGLVPMLKVFNDIARWVDQGGRRPGSIAIYLEPHHPDIFEFLELRKNVGDDTQRARDLFLALWISDLFMKQVEADGDWYLLSADECPGLNDTFGSEFESLYWGYVNENKYRQKVRARNLWLSILDSQIETGMPYITFKDNVNRKSNQANIGIIRSSNLCNEIVEYSDDKECAVCNLASISLKAFVKSYEFNSTDEWIIYTKPSCKYCYYAKNYLTNHNIKYTELPFNNDNLENLKNELKTNKITFPQIFIKNNNNLKHIGGWGELYKYTSGTFDYDELFKVAYLATENLNQVIDVNYYPVKEAKFSNMRHRPIGLGIQGLADALVLMRIPFDSEEAVQFNSKMMETIYLGSLSASVDIAKDRYLPIKNLIQYISDNSLEYPEYYDKNYDIGNNDMNELYHYLKPCKWELERNINTTTLGSYSTFDGSPFSQGKFQFDLWESKPYLHYKEKWEKLRNRMMKYGTRNSLTTALMPTASTSQILGNNECFEFFTNNIYTRKTQAGDFVIVNKYLIQDLINTGLWNPTLKDMIIASNGSIQNISDIPPQFKELYKTMWELKQVWVLKGAKARGPFVDQTQSMNIFMAGPDHQRLGSSHFWGWKNELKTGMYYLRSRPAVDAIKFTIDPNMIKNKLNSYQESSASPTKNGSPQSGSEFCTKQGCYVITEEPEEVGCTSCSG
jgi:ribonucleoside-diphosphate reductase alpha subunit